MTVSKETNEIPDCSKCLYRNKRITKKIRGETFRIKKKIKSEKLAVEAEG